jgi:hypothetical protein
MLPIPKELLGQKAIPFMEWCLKNKTEWEYGTMEHFHLFRSVLSFLSQPFTPEMLQEYFEGIRYDDKYKLYRTDSGLYFRYYDDNNHHYLRNNNEGFSEFSGLINLTLNDFITLCNLAGVTLTWKGEK